MNATGQSSKNATDAFKALKNVNPEVCYLNNKIRSYNPQPNSLHCILLHHKFLTLLKLQADCYFINLKTYHAVIALNYTVIAEKTYKGIYLWERRNNSKGVETSPRFQISYRGPWRITIAITIKAAPDPAIVRAS